jgi:UDP-3-O-[3-hydroxymyristoyl] glucosamine N-acyltransferase
VWHSIEGGRDYGGYWALPRGEWMRNQAHMNRISELAERVRALEKTLAKNLEKRLENEQGSGA